jgi:ABC-type polysaccharide/polyol phosphate export permease
MGPIFYTLDNLSFFFRRIIYWGNPLTAFVISFRGIFINNGSFNFNNYAYAVVLGFLLLVPSYFVFLIFENAAMERA